MSESTLTQLISSGRKSDIPVIHNIKKDTKAVVILCHGFASDKTNSTGCMLRERLAKDRISVLTFDLPGHGDRWADRDLTVENCLSDIGRCEAYARTLCPEGKIYYFGSSFGGYLTLLYIARKDPEGGRAFLRSAAVTMPELFDEDLLAEAPERDENGSFYMYFDYREPLLITKEFIESLHNNNLRDLYPCEGAEAFFVQGTDDEEVPYDTVADFTSKYGFELATFEGGDHRLSRPGMPEKVTELAADFFNR